MSWKANFLLSNYDDYYYCCYCCAEAPADDDLEEEDEVEDEEDDYEEEKPAAKKAKGAAGKAAGGKKGGQAAKGIIFMYLHFLNSHHSFPQIQHKYVFSCTCVLLSMYFREFSTRANWCCSVSLWGG